MDPLAEEFPDTSPYVFVNNNPLRFTDPTGMAAEDVIDPPSKGWNRFFGGLKMVGGVLETVAGATGGALTSWTGVGAVVGGAVAVHGADVAASGFMQMVTGENTSSFTSRAIQSAGVSKETADTIDAGISIVGTAGASSLANASKVTTVTSGAAKGGTKLISQFSNSTIDDAVTYAMNNKVTHVFGKAAHNLDPLVEKLGGQENTFRAVLNAANGKLPSSGIFSNISLNVGGYNVMIRGSVVNGVPKIGTMFIP